jgi:hypothetical protein
MELGREKYRALSNYQEISNSGVRKYAIRRCLTDIFCIYMLMAVIGGCADVSSKGTVLHESKCAGVQILGTLHDSLSNLPVSRAWIVLESKTSSSAANASTFLPVEKTTADTSGKFQLCSATLGNPSLIVASALDSNGNAYPPLVSQVSGTVDLGTILMGGCSLICGLEGQQQTSAPAIISGVVTSAPSSITTSVIPQYSLIALDGSNTVWNLSIPDLEDASSIVTTSSVNCAQGGTFCASYSFVLPSQKPMIEQGGKYEQNAGIPAYSVLGNASACVPSSSRASFEQNGMTPIFGNAGTNQSVQTISFGNCK